MNIDNSSTVTTKIIDKIGKFEKLLTSGQAILVDNAGNSLKNVEFPGEYDSEDDVASVDNDMARSMASEMVGFGTQGLLEQWRDSAESCRLVFVYGMERGFLSKKGSGVGRGVKEKDLNVANRKTVKDGVISPTIVGPNSNAANTDTGSMSKSDGTLDATPCAAKEDETTSADTAPGKSSYANVTGKPSGKKLNIHTLFTPGGNAINVVVPVESIRAISDRFANTAYGFFLGKRVAYPVVANYFHGRIRCYACEWSSYARVMIELRADVELKDNIVVAMPRIILVMFVLSMSGNPLGVPVGSKMGFKPQKEYRHVPKKPNASSSANKKKGVKPIIEVSNLNPFDVLNSVDNDVEFGTNGGISNLVNNEDTSSVFFFMNIDNDEEFASNTPIVHTGIVESDSEVEVVFDETANLRISASGKDGSDKCYGTNILLEQWRDSYPDNDDYDPYDDDMYENHDLSEHMQSICDDLDITIRGMKKK
nr:hypothetical protein [Tanacetum cinerariifolium]